MRHIHGLFAELKRRRVLRVVAIYAVGAIACVEAVEVFAEALNLPPWTLRLSAVLALTGLPIVVAVAWVFDLTRSGFRRTPRMESQDGLPSSRVVYGAGALAVLVLAAGVGWTMARASGPASRPAAPDRKSVAVLPLENLSAATEDQFFVSGIHDEIITRLVGVSDLKVIGRTSVLAYDGPRRNLRDVARELGVAAVVEGSVQRVGNRVRVRVQLVDATTDEHLWADGYDAELSDVFAVQGEIATRVAMALDARLGAGERRRLQRRAPASGEAYALYLRARHQWFRSAGVEEELLAAADLYRRALDLDSSFAAAHAGLSWVHSRLYWLRHDRSEARIQLARLEAERALALEPDVPEPHVALGIYWYYSDRDYERALREFRVALELAPSTPDAHLFTGFIQRRLGRWEAAAEALRAALDLDPLNPSVPRHLGLTYGFMRRWELSIALLDRAMALDPGNPVYTLDRGRLFVRWLGSTDSLRMALERIPPGWDMAAEASLARYELAVLDRRLDDALATLAQMPAVLENNDRYYPRPLLEALARRWLGDEEAREAFQAAASAAEAAVSERPDDALPLIALATAYAGLGRRAEAARAVDRVLYELLPEGRDAVSWRTMADDAALALALAGEREAALDLLTILLTTPSHLSPPLLRRHPGWDTLRPHPRFQDLVAMEDVDA